MTDDQGKDRRQSARPLVSVLATVFGGFGIALQQLSTGEPGSPSRWVMLVIGSFIGGAVGILATGLFDRMLNVAGAGWTYLVSLVRPRNLLILTALCTVALALGFVTPPAVDWARRVTYGCDQPAEVRVLTSTEQLAATRQIADAYEQWTAAAHHGCPTADLYVYAASPADAQDAVGSGWLNDALRRIGPRPDVWLPDSTLDVVRARAAATRYAVTLPIGTDVPVAYSPVVLGIPTGAVPPGLGDEREQLVWNTLWQKVGSIVRPDPATSDAGVLATAALYKSLAPTGQSLATPATARTVEQSLERALDQGGFPLGTSEDLLCRQLSTGATAAVIATELALVRFNQGSTGCGIADQRPGSHNSLLIFYPPDTLSEDHPLVRLDWSGVVPAARDFGKWLSGSDAGRQALLDAGLRPPGLFTVSDPLTEQNGAHAGVVFDRRQPDETTLGKVKDRYDGARRPGRVLLAIDASGSMKNAVDRSGTTRFQVARAGVSRSFGLLSDQDEFGVWVFSGDGPREIEPLGPAARHDEANAKLAAVGPADATPLYPTIEAGVKTVATNPDNRIASLVVLTDGNDTSGVRPSDVDAQVRGKGVRVFVVAIGEASCGSLALEDITTHTGGACYDAGVDSVDDVLVTLFGLLWGGDGG